LPKRGTKLRLGSRYGATLRNRLVAVDRGLRTKHECPSCGRRAVRRVSVGIWKCAKCGYTFTGGAYQPITKLGEVSRRSLRGVASQAIPTPVEEAETEEEDSEP